jgi:hypothetical protein
MVVMRERVGYRAGWTLYICDRQTIYFGYDREIIYGDWVRLKLEARDIKRRKSDWWLSWNGVRFARSHDSELLVKQHPEIHDWLVFVLSGF